MVGAYRHKRALPPKMAEAGRATFTCRFQGLAFFLQHHKKKKRKPDWETRKPFSLTAAYRSQRFKNMSSRLALATLRVWGKPRPHEMLPTFGSRSSSAVFHR